MPENRAEAAMIREGIGPTASLTSYQPGRTHFERDPDPAVDDPKVKATVHTAEIRAEPDCGPRRGDPNAA